MTDEHADDDGATTGPQRRRRAQGRRTDDLMALLDNLDSDLPRWADGFIFGDLWNRPGLDFQDRMLVAIVALAATGQHAQLETYLHGALQDGVPHERIHEAIVMLVIYVGFPTALDSLATWRSVLAAHQRHAARTQRPTSG